MKSLPIISLLILSILNLPNVANAKDEPNEIPENEVDAKCYVELIGGIEAISLWHIKPSSLQTLPAAIIGEEISLVVSPNLKTQKKKGTIYKTKQCVFADDDFISARARALDKDMPR